MTSALENWHGQKESSIWPPAYRPQSPLWREWLSVPTPQPPSLAWSLQLYTLNPPWRWSRWLRWSCRCRTTMRRLRQPEEEGRGYPSWAGQWGQKTSRRRERDLTSRTWGGSTACTGGTRGTAGTERNREGRTGRMCSSPSHVVDKGEESGHWTWCGGAGLHLLCR